MHQIVVTILYTFAPIFPEGTWPFSGTLFLWGSPTISTGSPA